MPIDITELIGTFSQVGGALSINHFMVTFTLPTKLNITGSTQNLSVLCDSAPLPGLQIATIDRSLPYGYGPNYKMPIGAVWADVDLRFIGDAQGYVHNIFSSWLDYIVKFNGGDQFLNVSDSTSAVTNPAAGASSTSAGPTPYFINYFDDIVSNINITAFDPIGKQIIKYTLFKTYPSMLGEVQGDWAAQDQLMRIPVKFNFVTWGVTYSAVTHPESTILSSLQNYISSSSGGGGFNLQSVLNQGLNIPPTSTPAFSQLMNAYENVIPGLPTANLYNA